MTVIFTVIVTLLAFPTTLTLTEYYKGYYRFNDTTSVLLLKGEITYGSNGLYVNFYDSNRNFVTKFRWYNNRLSLDGCDSSSSSLSSSNDFYMDYYGRSKPFNNLTIYKNDEKFIVATHNETIFVVLGTCSSVLKKKVKYITFTNDGAISSFQIDLVKCKPGYSLNNTLHCNICPPDTYSQNLECVPCPAVSTSPEGSKSYSDCMLKRCDPGYFLNIDGNCIICPNGTYSKGRQVSCSQCPDGKTSPQGSSGVKDCKACPPGYSFNNNTRTCSSCRNGTYTDRTRGFGCFPCPLGRTSKPTASSHKQCYWKCQPGEINSGDVCLKCPGNTYSGGRGETKCHRCPKNTEAPAGSSRKSNCKKVQPDNIIPVKDSSNLNTT